MDWIVRMVVPGTWQTKITDIKAEGGIITDDIFPAEEQELMELQQ